MKKETVRFSGLYFFVVMMCLVVTIPQPAFAQDTGFKPYSLSISSGDDPISSGITGIVQFTNERNRLVEVAVQQEQAWFIYGQKFKKSSVSGTLGWSYFGNEHVCWQGCWTKGLGPNFAVARTLWLGATQLEERWRAK